MTYHVTMSASDDCLLESEVRRKELAPRSVFELTTRSLTADRVRLEKSKVGAYSLAGSVAGRGTAGAYLAGRVADWKLHDEVTEEAPSERSCWRKSAGKSGGGFLL